MISDAERRKVARKLREDAANDKLREHVFVEEIIVGCIGETMHDEWGNVREVEILTKLADLIDRPTCKLVEAWDGEREQHYLDCTACHFGRRAIEQDDAGGWYNARELWRNVEYDDLTHCPYCGAEVVRDGD